MFLRKSYLCGRASEKPANLVSPNNESAFDLKICYMWRLSLYSLLFETSSDFSILTARNCFIQQCNKTQLKPHDICSFALKESNSYATRKGGLFTPFRYFPASLYKAMSVGWSVDNAFTVCFQQKSSINPVKVVYFEYFIGEVIHSFITTIHQLKHIQS